MLNIGIIGGTGLESITGFKLRSTENIKTNYGEPSSAYRVYESDGLNIYQLNRHGDNHSILPHNINYRANISGFKALGVECIVSFSVVGGINAAYNVGDLILLDNAIDFTSGRANTLYDKSVVHVDLSHPFCDDLNNALISASTAAGIKLQSGVYICTEGPRLETAAEIKMFRMMGADVVGMTLFPEVTFAREAEICYANISSVTNMAAGMVKGHKLTSDELVENGRKSALNIIKIVENLPSKLKYSRKCPCANALHGAAIE